MEDKQKQREDGVNQSLLVMGTVLEVFKVLPFEVFSYCQHRPHSTGGKPNTPQLGSLA
jgi:hypothetical protein